MSTKKKVLAISGSTKTQSANGLLIRAIVTLAADQFEVEIYNELAVLPHFNPDLDKDPLPPAVATLRNKLTAADGLLICTPEYVFSLPGSLKNAIEWLVSTTIPDQKPTALITASSQGAKAHEALLLIMKTVGACFNEQTQLHIPFIKTRINEAGTITDAATLQQVKQLIAAFTDILYKAHASTD